MSKWDSTGLKEEQEPRLEYLNRSEISDGLVEVYDSIVNSKRGVGTLSNGGLPGPFNAWMYTDPEMASALDKIGVAIRDNTKNVPDDMKAIAICTVAVHFKSNVEFWAHRQTAIKNGVAEEHLNQLLENKDPNFPSDDSGKRQKIAYVFAKEYLVSYRISDETYEQTLMIIGSKKGLIEFTLAMSHYVGLATQLNVFRVPNPGNQQIFDK